MAQLGGPGRLDYTAISPEDLLIACLHSDDDSAWAEFVHRFHPLIAGVVIRVAQQWGETSPQAMDDLIQETYLKLCSDKSRILQNFKSLHKDAIYGFIKVFTANLTHDHFKATRSQKRGGGDVSVSIDDHESDRASPELATRRSTIEHGVLMQEIDACVKAVTAGPDAERDRRIFWMYYRVGLPASAIAALPMVGLSTKGVESTIFRLTRQVRHRLAKPGREWSENVKEGLQSQ